MPTDHAPYQSFMAEMIQAARFAVTLSGRVHERQVVRLALQLWRAALARQVQFLERDRDRLGEPDADEAAGGNRIAVARSSARSGWLLSI